MVMNTVYPLLSVYSIFVIISLLSQGGINGYVLQQFELRFAQLMRKGLDNLDTMQ